MLIVAGVVVVAVEAVIGACGGGTEVVLVMSLVVVAADAATATCHGYL